MVQDATRRQTRRRYIATDAAADGSDPTATDAERRCREERGQGALLESLDDDVVREYAATVEDGGATDRTGSADE